VPSFVKNLEVGVDLASLAGKNVVVFDAEIKKPIEECSRGWDSHDEMGISVACMFDYVTMRYRVFMDDNIVELVQRMNIPGTLIVAFNQLHFDNKLIRAAGLDLKPDDELRNYDMLVESKQALCAGKYEKGFKLDDHLRMLGLPVKTANGALAPIMWKEKQYGTLIDYCLNDVYVEKTLFEHIWTEGTLACAFHPTEYKVRIPEVS
jgi:hypothetical protein